ncbi:hypothetical protein EV1_023978 [Malus domestica]
MVHDTLFLFVRVEISDKDFIKTHCMHYILSTFTHPNPNYAAPVAFLTAIAQTLNLCGWGLFWETWAAAGRFPQTFISVAKSQTSSSKTTATATTKKPIKIQHFDYSDLVAAINGFSDQKLLGKGSHGYVYKAMLRGRLVAVKRPSRAHNQTLRPNSCSGPETANEVNNEIEILSKIQSPRLVNLLGFSNDSKDRLLVVEFMSNGTLYDVLH